MFYFYKRMTGPFCDSAGKKIFPLCRQAGNTPNDTIKMHKKQLACMYAIVYNYE